MNILEGILYGIISGFSEFLPISSLGHQQLLRIFFGISSPEPLRDIFVHIGFLLAVLIGCGTYLEKLRHELHQNNTPKHRRSGVRNRTGLYDVRLLKNTAWIMILGMILFRILFPAVTSLNWIAFGFFINGLILFIPEYMPQGNKDSRKMSGFDSFLLGIGSALTVIPGFSRVGAALSGGIARGADKVKTYNWILVLTIPYVCLMLVFDIIVVFQSGFGIISFVSFLGAMLSGIFSFISSIAGIYLIRFMLIRSGFSVFAFYSWGAALLTFLLHLSA